MCDGHVGYGSVGFLSGVVEMHGDGADLKKCEAAARFSPNWSETSVIDQVVVEQHDGCGLCRGRKNPSASGQRTS